MIVRFSFLSVIMRRLKTAGVFLTPPQSTLLPNCPQTPQILLKLTMTMSIYPQFPVILHILFMPLKLHQSLLIRASTPQLNYPQFSLILQQVTLSCRLESLLKVQLTQH
ncbi:hypothetical protein AOLI_G00325010 [Acnodon oligacanthus]